ncbi:MAG: hypothetical protein HQL52_12785 [Magnetococcales bacterium]|nr:hypothetical protein [Magnetococcales bacterium]
MKEILALNGVKELIQPDVQGTVTATFDKVPLQTAFERMMDEFKLVASYAPATNTVTISTVASSTLKMESIFTPKSGSLDDIMGAMRRFRLLNDDVTLRSDSITDSIFLQGPQNRTTGLIKLMGQIDASFGSRQARLEQQSQKNIDRQGQALRERQMEQAMEDTRPMVKVIALRYASVGSTSTSFQGKTVTIPGIIESLNAFLSGNSFRDASQATTAPTGTGTILHPINPPILTSDSRTNSIIIQGTVEQISRIERILEELDKPVPLVEIEVIIINGSDSLSRTLGAQLGGNATVGNAEAGTSLVTTTYARPALETVSNAALNNSGIASLASTASGGGLGAFIFRGSRGLLDATLTALITQNDVQTIASPRLVTLNHQAAQITNSLHQSFAVSNGDETQIGLETVSSGVSLQITPSVIAGKDPGDIALVRLEITAQNSSPSNTGSGVVNLNDQEVQTSVIIPSSATFIMGGLFNTSRSETDTGTPFFKDIPLLGALFQTRTSGNTKNETVFLITPRVFSTNDIDPNQGRPTREYVQRERYLLKRSSLRIQDESHLLDLNQEVDADE